MLQTMASESSRFEPSQYQDLFYAAGLSFRVLNVSENEVNNAGFIGKQPHGGERLPALVYTQQLNNSDGHFDLLAPPNHLSGKVNLPTDAQKFVMNDYQNYSRSQPRN
jgi:hypothetical protein